MPVVRVRGPRKRLAGDCLAHDSVAGLLEEGRVLHERGLLRWHVDGECGGPETRVDEEDRIDVLPAISGGCAR
jgi:hypothetical protein